MKYRYVIAKNKNGALEPWSSLRRVTMPFSNKKKALATLKIEQKNGFCKRWKVYKVTSLAQATEVKDERRLRNRSKEKTS